MQPPQPILVAPLFPELSDALMDLIAGLSTAEWELPTACIGWSVADVARHLLGGDIGILATRRDDYRLTQASINGWDDLVAFINQRNVDWVETTRRMSPRLLCDMLRLTGTQVSAFFQTLDPYAIGVPVDWAGPNPAPVWLDLAREFTERWHHQQHIRDAVGKPGMTTPRYLAPVLDAFVRALPHTYRHMLAPEQTLVALTIAGAAGGTWFLYYAHGTWQLYVHVEQTPAARLIIDEAEAWRLFTKGMRPTDVHALIEGDAALAGHMLEMVSIIA